MNEIDFTQGGGFPLETDTLAEMQEAYNIFNKLGNLAGDKTILSGCVLNEETNTVSDGYIYFDGKIFKFIGGTPTPSIGVRINEVVTQRVFGNTVSKNVYTKRTAVLDASITSNLWSEFKRIYPLSSALVLNEIKMYAGNPNKLPVGWFVCDGENETIDLRSRFVVGYDSRNNFNDHRTVGNIGGLEKVILRKNEMPSHNHSWGFSTEGDDDNSGGSYDEFTKKPGVIPASSFENPIGYSGGNQPHENRPPYYTLAFIQFKGI
jgi:microcystin-dependent protein